MKIKQLTFLIFIFISSCSSAPEYLSEDNKNIYIKKKLDGAIPAYTACFNEHKRNNIDKGVAKLNFIISKSGKVRNVTTKLVSGRLNKLILNCVTKTGEALTFPPTSIGEIEINQPITFR